MNIYFALLIMFLIGLFFAADSIRVIVHVGFILIAVKVGLIILDMALWLYVLVHRAIEQGVFS